MSKNAYSKLKGNIKVTKHAIQRFKERQKNCNLSDNEIIKKIINQVRDSRLISLKGEIEHRSHKGYVYVCARKTDLLGMNYEIVVITLKISKVRKFNKPIGEDNARTANNKYVA